ncbi:unnamed protein product [Brassica oleracea var. botrytis]|uniref:(rape) hypothetical protein n=1 Tax=Brassica napus TaxID=3708 RepID=A0A816UY30_BRANA|nr:unnamed protein product [Brassica napus]
MKDALKVLKPLLNGGNDDRFLSQACLVLFRRLDGGPADMIDDMVSEDVFPLVVQLLGHSSSSVLPNVSRVVGNIVKCVESSSQDVLGTEIYDKAVNVLKMFWDEDEKKQNIAGMLFGSN